MDVKVESKGGNLETEEEDRVEVDVEIGLTEGMRVADIDLDLKLDPPKVVFS